MTEFEKWQQFLIVISLVVVLCVPIAFAWELFMRWYDRWCERTGAGYVGPRQKQRRVRRRLKAAVLVLIVVFMAGVTAPAKAREWRPATTEGISAQTFAYAVNLAKMSPDLGELGGLLKKYPESARGILEAAGVDIEAFCERHPDYVPLFEGEGATAER